MSIKKYNDKERICYKCQLLKLIEDFIKDKSKTLERGYICKDCKNIKNHDWRKNNGHKNVGKYGYVKIRFEILRRDKFTCQYCGRKAPDVELQVDHIILKSKGGKYVRENLATSCVECNLGKRDSLLV